jgi:hypothetical protein
MMIGCKVLIKQELTITLSFFYVIISTNYVLLGNIFSWEKKDNYLKVSMADFFLQI